MGLRDQLIQNASLEFERNIFYQKGFPRSTQFEEAYIALRKKENRLYDDETLKQLPAMAPVQALKHEWQMRNVSANKLMMYMKKKGTAKKILEVGCGNGWLANKMTTDLSSEVLAMDVNETELLQGAKVFSSENLSFVYGDVFTIDLNPIRFDCIVLASSVQYFRDIQSVLKQLLRLLMPTGEIHIIDSPIYRSDRAALAAEKRSVDHFTGLGHRDMARYYFHHTIKEIGIFNHRVLENPDSLILTIRRRLFKTTHPVFPWIVIKAD